MAVRLNSGERTNRRDRRKSELVELVPGVPIAMKKYLMWITLVVDEAGLGVEKHIVTRICEGTNGEKVVFHPKNVQTFENVFILIDKMLPLPATES